MLKNQSVISTIAGPEFINLKPTDISPLISSCDIKVFYIGQNRNHSAIDKNTATKISKTLRGNPIVGYFRKEKEDFDDHGEKVTIDSNGVSFECMTRPYGFVATDAKVWFQNFEDTDEFGNTVVREYLMTQGYLWTGQYDECQSVVDEGKPQSMELDDKKFPVDGHWATDNKTQREFFIINDATISKLCILGDDVEPCFEGASVTAPDISTSFTVQVNDKFTNNLCEGMKVFHNFALQLQGGQEMENTTPITNPEDGVTGATTETPAPETNHAKTDEDEKKPSTNNVKEDEKDKDKDANKSDDGAESNTDSNKDKDKDEEESKKKYELLQTEFAQIKSTYEALEAKYNELVNFKASVESKQKDDLIASFNMLDDSDPDKKDVIANKDKYSLEEIESKLSVICFRKKVNFNLESLSKNDNSTESNKPITTFNLNSVNDDYSGAPEWLKAVDMNKNKN